MQVNSSRQDMLQQVNTAVSDRVVTPEEMQRLQQALAESPLAEPDKLAVGQLLEKLGEFTQKKGDQYLSDPELSVIRAMAARLDSPPASRFSEELQTQNNIARQTAGAPQAQPVASAAGATEGKKDRSFFQIILDALKSLFQWIASLFGGDKNEVKGPGPAGSASPALFFGEQQPPLPAPQGLPPVENLQDYSEAEFQNRDYLNEYARPAAPADPAAFNQYMSVSALLARSQAQPATPPGAAAEVPVTEPAAADKPPAVSSSAPSGPMYQRSPYHDDNKFVPRFPMAAFHESGVYRKEADPYAVGAISRPSKSDDLGGKTYGTYQFESSVYPDGSSRGNRGGAGSTLSRFINDPANPFGAHLQAAAQKYGLASKAFDALWTKFSREYNQAFGQAQEAFVLKDKGDNVQHFMDLAQLSPEVRQDSRIVDLIMGTTNHVGSLADGAARYLAGLQQRAGHPLSANEVGKALAEYKETRISSWFISSPGAHAGLENRFKAEARAFS